MEKWLFAIVELANIFALFLCYTAVLLYLRCFYDSGFQWSWKKTGLLFICAGLENAVFYISDEVLVTIAAMAIVIIEFIVFLYNYQGKKWRGFWSALLALDTILIYTSTIYDIVTRYAIPYFTQLYNDPEFWEETVDLSRYITSDYYWGLLVLYLIEIIFFGFVCWYLYSRIVKRGIFLQRQKWEPIFLTVYCAVAVVLNLAFDWSSSNKQLNLSILGITFILAALLVPFFFYYLRVSGYYQERVKIQEGYIQAELAHFQQYQQMQEDTARFRHDIRNNLLCVSDMLQQGKPEEASAYLQDLLSIVGSLSKKYVTGDALLDSIVALKAQVMEASGIRFSLDGLLAGGLHWKPVDICSVFSNALDNAIEACRKLPEEERCIVMNIKSTAQYWFVTIENPVAQAVDTSKLFRKKGGYTSKADFTHHGIGTYNMKYAVESYGDMLRAECTPDTFRLEIIMAKSSSE